MNRIVYIDGGIADAMGATGLRKLASVLAAIAESPVDLITHGKSEFHFESRYTGQPVDDLSPSQAIEFLSGFGDI